MLYVFTRKKIQKMNERNESIAILGELISINDPSNQSQKNIFLEFIFLEK